MKAKNFLLIILSAIFAVSCSGTASNSGGQPTADNGEKKIKIGFAMDTLKEARWVRDKEAFEAHCKKMNVECVITVADNKAERQANDADNLLTQGIDVLVVAPTNATQAASIVDKAKEQNVPVISYDRLINSDKIDLYISHQVPVIGRVMAEYALKHVPKGNYVMVYGSPTDNNASIMKKEQLAVLQPSIDSGDIKIVVDNFIADWKPELARNFVENALTQNSDQIDAIIVSNDGMAGGAVSALETKSLAGKVLVTGQDAELQALQSIAEGKQTMTVYKAIVPLASQAVEAAIKLAKGESPGGEPFMNDSINKEVPAILLEIVVVDKNNLVDTVIKDGFATYDDVFRNVPEAQRPPRP